MPSRRNIIYRVEIKSIYFQKKKIIIILKPIWAGVDTKLKIYTEIKKTTNTNYYCNLQVILIIKIYNFYSIEEYISTVLLKLL